MQEAASAVAGIDGFVVSHLLPAVIIFRFPHP